jgi:hypothetical protein
MRPAEVSFYALLDGRGGTTGVCSVADGDIVASFVMTTPVETDM